MPARHRNVDLAEPSGPGITLDDFRGRTPEELRDLIAALDVRLSQLHSGPDGELRELDGQEQEQWDRWFRLREHRLARLREHDRMAAAASNPKALQRAYGGLSGAEAFARDAAEVLRMGGDELRSAAAIGTEVTICIEEKASVRYAPYVHFL